MKTGTIVAAAALFAALLSPAAAQKVLKVGIGLSDDHPQGLSVKKFGELLAQKSGGKLTAKLFASGALGNDVTMISALRGGTQEMVVPDSSTLVSLIKDFGVLNLPFTINTEAEAAATFYCSVFKNSRIGKVSRYVNEGQEIHGKPAGSVMAVEFELEGQRFAALNGGPQFTFDEAISFQVHCNDQSEVDYFWKKLSEGGEEGPCGWLKDRFGLSWQIVPKDLPELIGGPDPEKARRGTAAMMQMTKLDIAELRRAREG